MDSLRQLLAEQSASLLRAQQVQIGASLQAFEDRQSARIEGIEATVKQQGSTVSSLETQVRELAARVSQVEGRPVTATVGPDRRHTLVFGGWSQDTRKAVLLKQLSQAIATLGLQGCFDSDPFCTGARRSVALCQFRQRADEGTDQPRARMLHVIQIINASKVELAGGARPLWASFSKTPAERGRASLAAVVRKIILRLREPRLGDLEIEYNTGRTWIRDDQITGMGPPPDGLRSVKQVTTRALLNGAEGRDGECPDQSAPPHVSQSRNAPPDESDEMGLFQREPGRKDTWETMVEQFYVWFEEGRAVGMALRMVRSLAAGRDSEGYSSWLERPLGSLGVGIPACQGQESSRTPTDFFQWALSVESRLWTAYQQDQRAGLGRGAVEGDASSLMDNRYRHGRRRIRDSRTPRRSRARGTSRPTAREDARDRGRARQGNASSSQQGRQRRSEYVEIRVGEEERPTPGEPSSGSRDGRRGPQTVLAGCGAPNVSQPLTHSQSVQMWKRLLFDRNTYAAAPPGTGKVPGSFLLQGVLREVSMAHEGMIPQNRAQSTVALITVIRYLMAELAQVMDVADAIARTREGTMETSDLEEEETSSTRIARTPLIGGGPGHSCDGKRSWRDSPSR